MGKKFQREQATAFSLEGRFLSFEIEDGYKIKRLYLATATGEYRIKLTRQARLSLVGQGVVLQAGDWIQVVGQQKFNPDIQETKFKAESINPVTPKYAATYPQLAPTKTKILVCQKSDCMNRGGKAVCQALAVALGDRGLQDQVAIKGTGCMKHCKAGPNIVMPDKTRYSRITATDIPAIVDQHCPQPAQAAAVSPMLEVTSNLVTSSLI